MDNSEKMLLDLFAGQFMASLIIKADEDDLTNKRIVDEMADKAYNIAGAMIKSRRLNDDEDLLS